jgi:tellurite resistance protein TerC
MEISSIGSPWLLAGFSLLFFGVLALDLGVVNRKAKAVRTRDALLWTLFCVALALAFNVFLYLRFGAKPALEFLTGYLIEYALSVDNIFVFILIFNYFAVPAEHQHRVLFWGILGAVVLRGIFIVAGTALIAAFHWMIYVFGAFLVFTGIKMLVQKEIAIQPDKNPVVQLFRRFVRVSDRYEGDRFFTRIDGLLFATPLFLALVIVDIIDVIFAADSIPAILGVTQDPTIVFTSNIFAILGLRALYFLLASIVDRFHHLRIGIAFVLGFVGAKMMVGGFVHIPIAVSLGIIVACLGGSVLSSLLFPKRSKEA